MSRLPLRVTLLLLLVLFLSAWNGLRLWTAIAWESALDGFAARPAVWIIALSGAIGLIAGLLIVWGVLQKKAWTVKLLAGAAAGYSAWYWLEQLVFQQARPNRLFAVLLNLALLLFTFFATRSLTREAHDRKPKNPKDE